MDSLVDAMLRFEKVEHRFNPVKIQEWARSFDTSEFTREDIKVNRRCDD